MQENLLDTYHDYDTFDNGLNGSQLAKMKKKILTCHCHESYGEQAVGLKTSNYI